MGEKAFNMILLIESLFDVCFIGTNHDVFNYKKIANNLRIIFDSRNSFSETKKNIIII